MAAGKLHVRDERGVDQVGIGVRPDDPGEDADVAAFHEPEAARATGDLRDLPGVQVASLLAVELLRLGEEKGLAREVDAVAEDVGRAAHRGLAAHEPLDLEPAGRQRHSAVEHRDLARLPAVELARQREHGAAAERDHDGARPQALERDRTRPVERRLALEEAHLGLRERVLDQRQRLDGAEEENVPVLAREEQPCPGGAALAVVCPLHLVEHQDLTRERRHLGRAADDRRTLVHALLARHEADALGAQLGAQAAMRLLGEHPERCREDPAARVGEELERRVRLAGVRRPDVRDDGLRLSPPEGKDDLRLGDANVSGAPLPPLPAARPLLTAAMLSARSHAATLAGLGFLACACRCAAGGDRPSRPDPESRVPAGVRGRAGGRLRRPGGAAGQGREARPAGSGGV